MMKMSKTIGAAEECDMQDRAMQLANSKNVDAASTSFGNALQAHTTAAYMLNKDTLDTSTILDKVLSNSSLTQDLLSALNPTEVDMGLDELSMVTLASQKEKQLRYISVPYQLKSARKYGSRRLLGPHQVLSPHQKSRRHLQDGLLVRFP
ncbi:hypothetical protein GCK32_011791 [Trichostrongylus colubriformis]|uniref:Uncharacterized protein n=1 Tax=Trichostrongylus colubriformis TaxID=6319 RepID=A0AAN8F6Q8_TRICO